MNGVLRETFTVRSCHCDMMNAWLSNSVLEMMQETAGMHSDSFGLTREKMDSMNICWVLSRLTVEFSKMPALGNQILIEIYPTSEKLLFYPRSHVFYLADTMEEIGRAGSLWVLLDKNERKIVKNDTVTKGILLDQNRKPAVGSPATVRPLTSEPIKNVIQPRFSDIDINGHVNNTKYLLWCIDAIGMDVMKDYWISSFHVNFDAEVLYGMEIETELYLDDRAFAFIGSYEGKRRFAVGGRLEKRIL